MTKETRLIENIKFFTPPLLAIAFIVLVIFSPLPAPKENLSASLISANETTSAKSNSATTNQTADQIIKSEPAQNDFINKMLEEERKNPDEKYEKTFDKPINIVWGGEIYGFMMSGDALAIVRVPKNKKYPVFFAWSVSDNDRNIEGKIKITGKWTGITCAYRFTVFGNRCVPEVIIEKIEPYN